MNGNPFFFPEPIVDRITGLVISYDTVLVLSGNNVFDINEVYDGVVNSIIHELDIYEKRKHSIRKKTAN